MSSLTIVCKRKNDAMLYVPVTKGVCMYFTFHVLVAGSYGYTMLRLLVMIEVELRVGS